MTSLQLKPNLTAQLLGFGGLVPFVSLALIAIFFPEIQPKAVLFALMAYGACIISFLGAIYWGMVMREDMASSKFLIWGVTPSLLAWGSLILNNHWSFYIQVFTIWVCFAVDFKNYPLFGLSGWLKMRFTLSLVASVCLMLPLLTQTLP